MHYYCTYFDERYLVKGVTFIESLQKHDAACTIFVLCLDQKTKNVLDTLALPNVVTHLLNELEVENPDFHALRDSRTLVEYYWTMTPVVINYFFKYVPQNEILTYTDSDLFFFSSTDPIFQELQDYSVGIHGHNFPPCYKHLEKFGHYNVGWVSFRKDVEGEKVLAWWRKHCLKCCPYTIQTDSSGMICYGDQKYLDYFKDQSEQVHVFENIGVGVGPWNQIGYKISSDSDGTPCVNDIKTIFYHFHSYFQIAPNCDVPSNPDYSYTRESLVLFSIPYHEALQKSYQKILRVDPQYNANFNTSAAKAGSVFLLKGDAINIFANEGFNKIIKLEGDYALLAETNSPQESTSQTCVTNPTPISEEDTSPYPLPQQNYTGDYPDWETALKMTSGYDSDIILEKHLAAARAVKNGSALWERDSVVFHKPEVRQPLLNQLLHIAQQSDSHLHLLDFGGSFGSTYQQHRPYLIQIKDLSWNVVEQKHIVQIGQQEFQSERLKFFDSIEDVLTATKNNINAALFSGSIQYLDEPYFYLEKIVANKIPYIIFDRLTLLPDAAPQRDRISIQRVSPSIYDASYPCWWFSKEKLEAFLHKHGYDISKWHPSACDADGQWCALAQLKDPSSKLKSNTSERTPTCCIKEKPTLLQVDLFYPTYL
ncbi:MAG: methyltransferase, TIGR04325 family, partial [Bdellovibrionota bacterium]